MTRFIAKRPKTLEELQFHIKDHLPSLYFSSKTSTVIPYEHLESTLKWDSSSPFYLVDLSGIPKEMTLKGDILSITGAVSWEEARAFLQNKGHQLKTSPTEQLALVLAGLATSCTGERCFGFGTLRSQVQSLSYLNYLGEPVKLYAKNEFTYNSKLIAPYQASYQRYQDFKNAPFPRFLKETDLMIGTEGQLGIITQASISVKKANSLNFIFIKLPRWEDDFSPHQELFELVQSLRDKVYSVELLDSNCMNFLKPQERLGKDEDIIFLEVLSDEVENVFTALLNHCTLIKEEQIFEISENKFHQIRAAVPRAIFEDNAQMKVKKMGTDVQVSPQHFSNLIKHYRQMILKEVRYCLFGHFGDAHLHFNYMPKADEAKKCHKKFEELYQFINHIKGSPFAEHGVGLLKQPYIQHFYSDVQTNLFKELKQTHDPHNQFFPQGFMSLRK